MLSIVHTSYTMTTACTYAHEYEPTVYSFMYICTHTTGSFRRIKGLTMRPEEVQNHTWFLCILVCMIVGMSHRVAMPRIGKHEILKGSPAQTL